MAGWVGGCSFLGVARGLPFAPRGRGGADSHPRKLAFSSSPPQAIGQGVNVYGQLLNLREQGQELFVTKMQTCPPVHRDWLTAYSKHFFFQGNRRTSSGQVHSRASAYVRGTENQSPAGEKGKASDCG